MYEWDSPDSGSFGLVKGPSNLSFILRSIRYCECEFACTFMILGGCPSWFEMCELCSLPLFIIHLNMSTRWSPRARPLACVYSPSITFYSTSFLSPTTTTTSSLSRVLLPPAVQGSLGVGEVRPSCGCGGVRVPFKHAAVVEADWCEFRML